MLWHAMPPELNTARLMAGAGPAPMLAAAAGWQTLSAALDAQAVELTARLNSLGEAWTGGGSDKALAAATPMVVWLQTASTQAKTRAMQATAQAAAYTQAMATTPSLPEIAANHITQAVLTATNFFGINTIPIALTEMDYFIRMWNQAALAMEVYQAETAVNTLFEKLEPMASILDPGASQSTTNPIFGMPSPGSSTPVGQLPPAATQTLGQLGEMSGPMQQLTQPLQQLTSLFSQVGGTGGGSRRGSRADGPARHQSAVEPSAGWWIRPQRGRGPAARGVATWRRWVVDPHAADVSADRKAGCPLGDAGGCCRIVGDGWRRSGGCGSDGPGCAIRRLHQAGSGRAGTARAGA